MFSGDEGFRVCSVIGLGMAEEQRFCRPPLVPWHDLRKAPERGFVLRLQRLHVAAAAVCHGAPTCHVFSTLPDWGKTLLRAEEMWHSASSPELGKKGPRLSTGLHRDFCLAKVGPLYQGPSLPDLVKTKAPEAGCHGSDMSAAALSHFRSCPWLLHHPQADHVCAEGLSLAHSPKARAAGSFQTAMAVAKRPGGGWGGGGLFENSASILQSQLGYDILSRGSAGCGLDDQWVVA